MQRCYRFIESINKFSVSFICPGFFTAGCCVVPNIAQGKVYSIDLESQLRSELFENYSTVQRPEKKVLIMADLTLLTINDMVRISID